MLQEYTRYKILREFFIYPTKNLQMREISRNTKISQPSVINHLKALMKYELIIKEDKTIYPSYKANRDSKSFRIYKKLDLIIRLEETGIINYINDECLPNCIILFGSASLGEDIESSDIDLFIQSKEVKLNIEKFEKILKRKVNLLFDDKFSRLSDELKNNIINGVKIKGYLKVF